MSLKTAASSSDGGRGYTPPADAQEKMFYRQICDRIEAVRRSGAPRFTMFCNEREQELAGAALSSAGCVSYFWDGGYEGAQRRMLCIYESGPRPMPFVRLAIEPGPQASSLTHRDYLGALMGLKIARECIGDILCSAQGAQLVAASAAAKLILDELTEVGRCRVTVRAIDALTVPERKEGTERTVTLASLRLDSLLAAMLRVSRSEAVRKIVGGSVEINHMHKCDPDEPVYRGDVFSVRGHGRFELTEIGDKSRKGRIFVTFTEF